jgi:hypothetical protein
VRFYDGLFLSFFYLQRCFFFMLFLQEENAAKAEKNDQKNDILNHKNQRSQFWTASSKSFSESYIVLFKSHAARRFIKRNQLSTEPSLLSTRISPGPNFARPLA